VTISLLHIRSGWMTALPQFCAMQAEAFATSPPSSEITYYHLSTLMLQQKRKIILQQ
jgi:hypothetical protein